MPANSFDPVPVPFFSVVIPTRDRPATLVQAVASVMAQDFRDFELLVVDNAGTPPAREILAASANPHLRVIAAPQRLAMHRNWELGLSAARGRYLIFIGDDDAMMPDGLRLARELLRGSPVDLLCWPTHDYKWPDAAQAAGVLTVRFGALAGELDLAVHLERIYSLAGPEIYLTSIYHGAVSAELVARVSAQQGGSYFSDPVCDIESEILNARFARNALVSQRPITMNGHSGGSNGGANGRLDRLTAAYDRFAAEAGLEPRALTPGGVDLPLYHGVLVAGCQQRVKARHFPADDRLRHDPERLLRYLIGSSGVFGAARPADLPARFLRAAQALGVTSGGATLPALLEPPRPLPGLTVDDGGQHRLVVEAGQAGISDILGAIRLTQAMLPPFGALARGGPAG